mmetsp:Transcript_3246/g.10110  ORF Transcript_3246/g.10110 Transcript_3246/m.10110 type:complete len:201 (-) Transcript_3246:307-909(-)
MRCCRCGSTRSYSPSVKSLASAAVPRRSPSCKRPSIPSGGTNGASFSPSARCTLPLWLCMPYTSRPIPDGSGPRSAARTHSGRRGGSRAAFAGTFRARCTRTSRRAPKERATCRSAVWTAARRAQTLNRPCEPHFARIPIAGPRHMLRPAAASSWRRRPKRSRLGTSCVVIRTGSLRSERGAPSTVGLRSTTASSTAAAL